MAFGPVAVAREDYDPLTREIGHNFWWHAHLPTCTRLSTLSVVFMPTAAGAAYMTVRSPAGTLLTYLHL